MVILRCPKGSPGSRLTGSSRGHCTTLSGCLLVDSEGQGETSEFHEQGPIVTLDFFQKHCYVEYRSIVMLGKVFPESIDRSFGRSIVCGEGAMSPE